MSESQVKQDALSFVEFNFENSIKKKIIQTKKFWNTQINNFKLQVNYIRRWKCSVSCWKVEDVYRQQQILT